MLQTLASTRNRESAQLLAAIDRALAKLADRPDEYGTCEDCEEDIPARRLEVMPWAALCTECQSKQDPKRNVARKKITDYR
jgi:DnaK suppressor protein